ncbi:acyltransferase family protein [Planosporangium sp. 12N6]|uniref:acyltransferase family protein n=1 Tax=Planosporangium spinosum TaxID=3402278 RepID=UPI003CE6C42E
MTIAARRPTRSRPAAGWAHRIAAGTPAHRDRTVDALRAAAIVGVVLGHWMVSAVVADPYRASALHGESPQSYAPQFAPASWFLQTLGPFFFAGGYAAARGSAHRRALPWLASRLDRLLRPVLVLVAVWAPAMLLLAAADAPASTRHVVRSLVSHPLWFLLVYVALTVLTPVLRPLVRRAGPWAALPAVALVAVTDAARPDLPLWWHLLAVPVAWAVPYLLGIALAENRLPRRAGAVLLPLGLAGGAALVVGAGYPASAVGVPGDRWSNLDPPSMFALALVFAQLGAFLLLRPWLAGLLRRPAAWAPVAAANLAAMTLYCWHQTALLLVTFAALPVGPLPGLLDAPRRAWPVHRLAWLPLFALVLGGLTVVFHRFESAGGPARGSRPRRPPLIDSLRHRL